MSDFRNSELPRCTRATTTYINAPYPRNRTATATAINPHESSVPRLCALVTVCRIICDTSDRHSYAHAWWGPQRTYMSASLTCGSTVMCQAPEPPRTEWGSVDLHLISVDICSSPGHWTALTLAVNLKLGYAAKVWTTGTPTAYSGWPWQAPSPEVSRWELDCRQLIRRVTAAKAKAH